MFTERSVASVMTCTVYCRADIKQYIGMPSVSAIYRIYHSCLKELTRVSPPSPLPPPSSSHYLVLQVGLVSSSHQLLDLKTLEVLCFLENDTTKLSLRLRDIARCVHPWPVKLQGCQVKALTIGYQVKPGAGSH